MPDAAPGPRVAPIALLLVALAAGAGCSERSPEPPYASPELRDHGLPPVYVPGDHFLVAPGGDSAAFLEAFGMESNPGLADASAFAAPNTVPRLAWGAVYARASAPREAVAGIALEFESRADAASWAAAPATSTDGTRLLLHDGRYVTVVQPLDQGDLATASEAAGRLAALLGARVECRPGAWPPDPAFGVGFPAASEPLASGRNETGSLPLVGGQAWFRVELGRTSLLTVDLSADAEPALRIELLDGGRNLLSAGAPALLQGVAGRVQETLVPGLYFLRVLHQDPCGEAAGFGVLAWAVDTTPDTDNGPAAATALTAGVHGPFTLHPGTEEDWYRFDLEEPSRVAVAVRQGRGELGGATRMWLYDAEGVELYRRDNPEPGLDEGRMGHDLGPGTYFVRVLSLGEQVVFQYFLEYGEGPIPPS